MYISCADAHKRLDSAGSDLLELLLQQTAAGQGTGKAPPKPTASTEGLHNESQLQDSAHRGLCSAGSDLLELLLQQTAAGQGTGKALPEPTASTEGLHNESQLLEEGSENPQHFQHKGSEEAALQQMLDVAFVTVRCCLHATPSCAACSCQKVTGAQATRLSCTCL